MLRRDRRGFGPARAPITLRARDGMETPAVALTFWPADDSDGAIAHAGVLPGRKRRKRPRAPRAADRRRSTACSRMRRSARRCSTAPIRRRRRSLDSNPALMEMTQGRATPGARSPICSMRRKGRARWRTAARRRRTSRSRSRSRPIRRSRRTCISRAAPDGRGARLRAERLRAARTGDAPGAVGEDARDRRTGRRRRARFQQSAHRGDATTEYLLRRHPVGDADFDDLHEITTHALRARELSEMLRAYARQQTFARELFEFGDSWSRRQELIRRIVGDGDPVRDRPRARPAVREGRQDPARARAGQSRHQCARCDDAEGRRAARRQAHDAHGVATAEEARALGHIPIEDGDYV